MTHPTKDNSRARKSGKDVTVPPRLMPELNNVLQRRIHHLSDPAKLRRFIMKIGRELIQHTTQLGGLLLQHH